MAFAKSNLCRSPVEHRDDVRERVRRDRHSLTGSARECRYAQGDMRRVRQATLQRS